MKSVTASLVALALALGAMTTVVPASAQVNSWTSVNSGGGGTNG